MGDTCSRHRIADGVRRDRATWQSTLQSVTTWPAPPPLPEISWIMVSGRFVSNHNQNLIEICRDCRNLITGHHIATNLYTRHDTAMSNFALITLLEYGSKQNFPSNFDCKISLTKWTPWIETYICNCLFWKEQIIVKYSIKIRTRTYHCVIT